MKNKKGFTLVELLAVIVILIVVLAITIPIISNIIESTKKASFKSDAKMILDQIRIEKAKDDAFDPTSITYANLSNYNISNENYESLTVSMVNNIPNIYVVGKNKWLGYKACGTYQALYVYLTTEEGVCGGEAPIATNVSAEILIVGGGGGGGNGANAVSNGGGGGGGDVVYLSDYELSTGNYDIVVGSGGSANTTGGTSSFNGNEAIGGGAGGSGDPKGNGGPGASGGGGTGGTQQGTAGNGTAGYAGGNGVGGSTYSGGGGGGQYNAGNTYGIAVGGLGLFYDISGTYICYGSGGGGASNTLTPYAQPGAGSSGMAAGGNAPAGQGGGGGGGNGGFGSYAGGNGGSGIVIIKYLTSAMAIDAPTGTQTTNGDYTILTFTMTGNHTIAVN